MNQVPLHIKGELKTAKDFLHSFFPFFYPVFGRSFTSRFKDRIQRRKNTVVTILFSKVIKAALNPQSVLTLFGHRRKTISGYS